MPSAPSARRIAAALALSAAAAGAAVAQQERPLVAEDLYRLRFAGDVAVSPDGRSVAYVVSRADSAADRYERDLWLAAADGSGARPLTFTREAAESSPAFSPDGRHLAFVSRREGDDAGQVYVLPLTGPGEARAVTALETGAASPVWAPDSRRIAFLSGLAAEEPDTTAPPGPLSIREKLERNARRGDPLVVTRLDYLDESGVIEREEWTQIFVVDALAATAEPVRITRAPHDHGRPGWSADGRQLVFSAAPPQGPYHPDYEQDSDLYVAAADGSGEPRRLTGDDRRPAPVAYPAPGSGGPAPYRESGPRYSPDGRWLAFSRSATGMHDTAVNDELVIMPAAGGTARCVSCALDREVGGYAWDPASGDLFFTVSQRGSVPLYRVGAAGGEPQRVLGGERGVLSFDVAGGTVAWAQMEPADPSAVWAAAATGERERRLTTLNDSLLAAVHVQPYEELLFEAPDGVEVQGWVVRPPAPVLAAAPGRLPPLAVQIHGGPHAMWGPGEQSMWLEYQMLAGAGYTVFLSNPRGSGGYGFEWKRAIYRDWGELPMGDVLAGADATLARGWADPERQVVTGGSYAGYLTAWIIGHTDRFDAAVSQRGVYDMAGWYAGSNTWRLYEGEYGAFPWTDPVMAFEASPIAHVDAITTPLLIIHGENDRRTTIATAEMLYRALKVLGRDVEFARYPRATHELSRAGEPHQRVDRLLRILEFFERYVGEATPVRVVQP